MKHFLFAMSIAFTFCALCVSSVRGQNEIPEYVQLEVDAAITAFHVNRLIKVPYAVCVLAEYTFVDVRDNDRSRYVQANMVYSSLPGSQASKVATRADYNVDQMIDGLSRPSQHWFTRLINDGKTFYNHNRQWTEIPPDSKVRFSGKSFDPWSATIAQIGDFNRNKVDEPYFDSLTVPDRLVEATLDRRFITASWLVSPRRNAKVTVMFDRTTKLPVEAEWRVRTGDERSENWGRVISNTRSQWKQTKLGGWIPKQLSISNRSDSGRDYQWNLVLDWKIGGDVDPGWFNAKVAPDGETLFQLLRQ
jgi:hypothetical protein